MQKGTLVYIVSCDSTPDRFKIGKTKDIKGRMRNYHTILPGEEKVEYVRYVKNMKLVEECVHHFLTKYRMNKAPKSRKEKEWFIGDLEMFKQELDLVADFFEYREKVRQVPLPSPSPPKGKKKSTPTPNVVNDEGDILCPGCEYLFNSADVNEEGKCEACADVMCGICEEMYLPSEINHHGLCRMCSGIENL